MQGIFQRTHGVREHGSVLDHTTGTAAGHLAKPTVTTGTAAGHLAKPTVTAKYRTGAGHDIPVALS